MIERLDKFLSSANVGTRKEIKNLILRDCVTVDGLVVRDYSLKKDFSMSTVMVNGQTISKIESMVCVLNKPQGYVTSTDDPYSQTVMTLIPSEYRLCNLLPVGRLDKDTEGVLLFTNNGLLLHKLISPKSNVEKTYYAVFEGSCPSDAKERFLSGITLKDKSVCKSADFEKLSETEFRITITEGMYHQVKRMAASLGMHVTYLKRESFCNIRCDDLPLGQFKVLKDFKF